MAGDGEGVDMMDDADDNNLSDETPLLMMSEVERWKEELYQLVEASKITNGRVDWLRKRIIAADVLIEAKKESK